MNLRNLTLGGLALAVFACQSQDVEEQPRPLAEHEPLIARAMAAHAAITDENVAQYEKFLQQGLPQPEYTKTFHVGADDWAASGSNPFFDLEPGYELVLAGMEDGEKVTLTILVTDETKKVDGVETRVVTETEAKGGKVIEISRNFFAMSKKTNSVFYFGEEVDIYKDGKVVSHEGAWLAGEKDARWGLMMPGICLLGARYHQEIAPEVAMDRAEITDLAFTCETPAGKFENCLVTKETSSLEKSASTKVYARGIGLITDGDLKLTRHGKKK